ncbi:MAG: hypothetical protein V7K69_30810 [Nostoc sp.]|uniref:hypothetical protein n=1 Tax=Nostoc sp. TaxID=1180 RepID=UPI002FFC6D6A
MNTPATFIIPLAKQNERTYSELQSNVPQLKAILGFVLGFIFVAGLMENCCS